MPSQTARLYKEALPVLNKVSFWEWVARIAAIVGILGTIITFYYAPQTLNEFLYSIFLIFLVLSLVGYVLISESKKLNRYAQAVLFVHYVNHIVRDCLESQRRHSQVSISLDSLNIEILDAISRCYSIVTGKNCRCCIKELGKGQELITIARDSVSSKVGDNRNREIKHILDKNTDFKSLWYGKDGATRYFLENNLVNLYRDGLYDNSSFEETGNPKVREFLLVAKCISQWKLPYKSTLVLPIRYLSDTQISEGSDGVTEYQHYWGFLCIDCNSRNVFDSTFAPELGGAFSDCLYTLYSQLKEMSGHLKEMEIATNSIVK